jgi:hypothetical protein
MPASSLLESFSIMRFTNLLSVWLLLSQVDAAFLPLGRVERNPCRFSAIGTDDVPEIVKSYQQLTPESPFQDLSLPRALVVNSPPGVPNAVSQSVSAPDQFVKVDSSKLEGSLQNSLDSIRESVASIKASIEATRESIKESVVEGTRLAESNPTEGSDKVPILANVVKDSKLGEYFQTSVDSMRGSLFSIKDSVEATKESLRGLSSTDAADKVTAIKDSKIGEYFHSSVDSMGGSLSSIKDSIEATKESAVKDFKLGEYFHTSLDSMSGSLSSIKDSIEATKETGVKDSKLGEYFQTSVDSVRGSLFSMKDSVEAAKESLRSLSSANAADRATVKYFTLGEYFQTSVDSMRENAFEFGKHPYESLRSISPAVDSWIAASFAVFLAVKASEIGVYEGRIEMQVILNEESAARLELELQVVRDYDVFIPLEKRSTALFMTKHVLTVCFWTCCSMQRLQKSNG